MYKLNELKGNQLFGSAFSFITKFETNITINERMVDMAMLFIGTTCLMIFEDIGVYIDCFDVFVFWVLLSEVVSFAYFVSYWFW